ncbi:magnesium/cobalt transporter CorA [Bacillus massilinigeriensis]|uniref:magnesium/cobalt transporter CorA n=1 Tax=Bacillus massilionigeriensis TaxID=1805475 RepID=UPI00096B6643|nr:magnesium/cobalt transporter CorA [Bacillus massilionigeriensis]
MIRTTVIKGDNEVLFNVPMKERHHPDIKWFWVDFNVPTEEESRLLEKVFKFHPLSVEDCLDEFSQRPKVDFFEKYMFFIVHAIHQETLNATEIDVFVSDQYIITFHQTPVRELNNLWERVRKDEKLRESPFLILHAIIDKLVDDYYPPVYQIEDELNSIEENSKDETINELMEYLFEVRTELSSLRRTILPMRDLIYRIIHSERMSNLSEHKVYFHDVHDHLLKLSELLESYREFSADIRDNYLSFNSNSMNTIMMTLTVITTIFMPLTFIAGIYGMNFHNMPELEWKYGYFLILGLMGLIAIIMVWIFKIKGWFGLGRRYSKRKHHHIKMK